MENGYWVGLYNICSKVINFPFYALNVISYDSLTSLLVQKHKFIPIIKFKDSCPIKGIGVGSDFITMLHNQLDVLSIGSDSLYLWSHDRERLNLQYDGSFEVIHPSLPDLWWILSLIEDH